MFRNIFAAVVLSLCLGLAVAPSVVLADTGDEETDYLPWHPNGYCGPHIVPRPNTDGDVFWVGDLIFFKHGGSDDTPPLYLKSMWAPDRCF